jgi:predicted nucleic acid-binding protein
MPLIDTGYLIALLNPHDQLHARADAWSTHVTQGLVITEYVIWETVNFFSKPVNRAKVHALLAHLRSTGRYEIVAASSELFEAGLRVHAERPDKEWSLTDCISFVVMERRGITRALSYDQHFEQAGFEALLRHDPST